MRNIFKKIKSSGFALLFTVVLVSVVLLIAIGISNIALKEVLLSISGKDANDAFFAADTGVECALYLDRQNPPSPFDSGADTPDCAGFHITDWSSSPSGGGVASTFHLTNVGYTGTSCAIVEVTKDLTAVPPDPQVDIISKGYNSCDGSGNPEGAKAVERELEVTY